jgi:hypothetical protein
MRNATTDKGFQPDTGNLKPNTSLLIASERPDTFVQSTSRPASVSFAFGGHSL